MRPAGQVAWACKWDSAGPRAKKKSFFSEKIKEECSSREIVIELDGDCASAVVMTPAKMRGRPMLRFASIWSGWEEEEASRLRRINENERNDCIIAGPGITHTCGLNNDVCDQSSREKPRRRCSAHKEITRLIMDPS